MSRHHGNVPCLNAEQQAYLRRVQKVRARMTNKALAHHFGVSVATVVKYMTGRRTGRAA